MNIKIDKDRCTGCGLCTEACPADAIMVDEVAIINVEVCKDCGACVDECPNDAIYIEQAAVASPLRNVPSAIPSRPLALQKATLSTIRRSSGGPSGFQQAGGESFLGKIFDFIVDRFANQNQSRNDGRGTGRGRGMGYGRGKGLGGGRGRSGSMGRGKGRSR